MKREWIFYLTLFLFENARANYPKTTRKCYSYLTQPDHKLICPEARFDYLTSIFLLSLIFLNVSLGQIIVSKRFLH
jgi:hypothetical protein